MFSAIELLKIIKHKCVMPLKTFKHKCLVSNEGLQSILKHTCFGGAIINNVAI